MFVALHRIDTDGTCHEVEGIVVVLVPVRDYCCIVVSCQMREDGG